METHMENQVQNHYACPDLAAAIRAGLETAGKSPDAITPRDLTPVDQLHTGGPKATISLMEKAGIAADGVVLDAGCGIGGSTRLLARQFNLQVDGIDITPDFIDTARVLTHWCGMEKGHTIGFHQGSVLDLPFDNTRFDAVLCQHILMNIEDKAKALSEFNRVLTPGGKLILHEIIDGPGPQPLMPVPWGADASTSFVPRWETLKVQLADAGFDVEYFSDETKNAAAWWQMVNTIRKKKGIPAVNTGLIFGSMADHFGPNLEKNFSSHAIGCIEAILIKPA